MVPVVPLDNASSVEDIFLLTDGRTYGDGVQYLSLVIIEKMQGIGISSLGIGSEWDDTFLDQLAGSTGGSTVDITKDQDIQRFLEQKFYRLSQIYADSVSYRIKKKSGVEFQYAFRNDTFTNKEGGVQCQLAGASWPYPGYDQP